MDSVVVMWEEVRFPRVEQGSDSPFCKEFVRVWASSLSDAEVEESRRVDQGTSDPGTETPGQPQVWSYQEKE